MVRPKGRLRRSSRAIDARQRAHGDLDGATVNGAAAGAQQAADHRSSYIFGVEIFTKFLHLVDFFHLVSIRHLSPSCTLRPSKVVVP